MNLMGLLVTEKHIQYVNRFHFLLLLAHVKRENLSNTNELHSNTINETLCHSLSLTLQS